MNILLIDNGTIHIQELVKILLGHNIIKTSREEINLTECEKYDLIILSGSSDKSVVNNPEVYKKEIELIKTSNIPIIGICMGFEVIAYAYNSKLKELPFKESGLVEVAVTSDNKIFEHHKFFKVFENHRWAVVSLSDSLEELAISKDGIEALKHKNKDIYGFQFHPEIFNEQNTGIVIFKNLLSIIEH